MKITKRYLALLAFVIFLSGCSKAKDLTKVENMQSSSVQTKPEKTEAKLNRLSRESSPYLLQHAGNPVNWYPWGKEAFLKAQEENKPIFLSVGYSSCHWCHVMAHESFEDPEIAEVLNREFISIKVDREERPEIDEIYMKATQLLTGSGGWPNSLFLTPKGEPFYAGTYFPPDDRYGRPGFKTLLIQLANLWTQQRSQVQTQAKKIWEAMIALTEQPAGSRAGSPNRQGMILALTELRQSFDRTNGGFGSAPKFPPHGALRLLLDEYQRHQDPEILEMATVTLEKMARGGIHDQLGGGFHRYSTDQNWFAPHFEKMLYDNAQLLRSYTDGYRLSGKEIFRETAIDIGDWVLREMRDKQGGFYSALDADSEGEEGKFYIWDWDQIISVLGEKEGNLFALAYGLTPTGNWEDKTTHKSKSSNIIFLSQPLSEISKTEKIKEKELQVRLTRARTQLLKSRDKRTRPYLDDKIMTDWNGLMIGSLAYAGKTLAKPRLLEAAQQAARFILNNLKPQGQLHHTYRAGLTRIPAYLDDYAFLADGLLELYQATGQKEWLTEAQQLVDEMLQNFQDHQHGGLFFVSEEAATKDSPIPLFRSKDPYDRAVPAGNGVAARVLIELGNITQQNLYLDQAFSLLQSFQVEMETAPRGTESLILASALYLDQVPEAGLSEIQDVSNSELRDQAVKSPVAIEILSQKNKSYLKQRRLTVRIMIENGWHINSHHPLQNYLLPTKIELEENLNWALEPIAYPPGEETTLPFSSENLSVYTGTVDIPLKLSPKKNLSRNTLRVKVSFQPCNEQSCAKPETTILTFQP